MKAQIPHFSIIPIRKGFTSCLVSLLIGLLSFVCLSLFFVPQASAQIRINILAVNGTEKTKDKEIDYQLPSELTREDILNADGLKVEYDVNAGAYFVKGEVTLDPKETKTYKVRIRDIWRLDPQRIEEIKEQIDRGVESVKDVKGKDYTDTATVLKQRLLDRIEFIVGEHQKYEDNVARRIDTYRTYESELDDIRRKSLSLSFWKSDPEEERRNVVKFFVTLENTLDEKKTNKQKHYLPKEVKPEHFLNFHGFELRYDDKMETLYLQKEEVLDPQETKKYEFTLTDVWRILQKDIDGLKQRAKDAFEGIKRTKYYETGKYLVKSIESKLRKIEETQELDMGIYEHISLFRKNQERFAAAKKDVEALEALLIEAKQEMEKSKLKNVLQKIQSLRSVALIAESVIKSPKMTVVLKVIIGIIIFVGVLTILWFFHWKRRTKVDMIEDEDSKK